MKNKKGQISGLVLVIGIIFLVLIIGFILVIGTSVTRYVADVVVPPLSSLGMVGNTNLTEVATYTIHPVDSIIHTLNWFTGVIYVMALIGCLGLAFIIRISPSKWLIGFYFLLVILLIIGSILISNMYQDFYNDAGDFAAIMNQNIIMSYMMLYAPMINTVIAFISGIIIFSGRAEEEAYV